MGLFRKLFQNDNKPKEQQAAPVIPQTAAEPVQATQSVRIPCDRCDGFYKVRDGKYGMFAGCSHYPACKSTLSLPDLVLRYIETYGLNIYRWEKQCYKCGNATPVYSYYLDYDLADLDEIFSMGGPTVGLGDLSHVDDLLSKQIPTIQMRYSNTTRSSYMANTCVHCGALQGRNYVVDDPHEIIGELWHDRGMNKFYYTRLKLTDCSKIAEEIRQLYRQER